jgi:transposase
LKSIGRKFGKIILPINHTRHSRKLSVIGDQLKSFLIASDGIQFRYDIKVSKKKQGSTEGGDQGISTCVTLSDGQVTQKCPHGHDLMSILKKMKSQKRGSLAFNRSQEHRTNYINWSIAQLNLQDIKKLNLENIFQIGRGQSKSRLLSSWSYTEIKTALMKRCELAGVSLALTSNPYRSQRCHGCGFVHKSNRSGKMFVCGSCGLTHDADLNAAKNHKVKLYDIPYRQSHLPNKSTGFFWTPVGIYSPDGEAITVPLAKK